MRICEYKPPSRVILFFLCPSIMAPPILYLLEEEGIIKEGMTEAEHKSAWRAWELRNHPDKPGGSTAKFVKYRGYKDDLDKKLSMRDVRKYFNALSVLDRRLAERDVPPTRAAKLREQYAEAAWSRRQRMAKFFGVLKMDLEKRKWPSADIRTLIRDLKVVQDTRPAGKPPPQRRISWVAPTARTSRCRKCSATAASTGRKCKLSASCRMGCEVRCWRHASTHVTRVSCRD